jgi:ribosomal RNA-processing protein 12
MVRKFGYEKILQSCPESDRKLIVNIRKTKERSKKKRSAAKDDEDENSEEEGDGRQGGQFESAYDQALYSSDSDEAAGSDGGGAQRRNTSRRKERNAYILEDGDEPLDLLDRRALANISTTKPIKLRKPTVAKTAVNHDGKLILGQDNRGDDAMEVDPPGPEQSGVGAYVDALKGKDVGRRIRGGKLKFSNRRTKEHEMEDMDAEDAVAIKSRTSVGRERGGGRREQPTRGGRSGRGGFADGRRGLEAGKRRGKSMRSGIRKIKKGSR